MQVKSFSGKKLEQARLHAGMTQADLAYAVRSRSAVKTTERNVRRWEDGTTRAPHAAVVALLSDVLNVSMDDLYATDDNGDGRSSKSDDDEEDDSEAMTRAAYHLDRAGEFALADNLRARARRAAMKARREQRHEVDA